MVDTSDELLNLHFEEQLNIINDSYIVGSDKQPDKPDRGDHNCASSHSRRLDRRAQKTTTFNFALSRQNTKADDSRGESRSNA